MRPYHKYLIFIVLLLGCLFFSCSVDDSEESLSLGLTCHEIIPDVCPGLEGKIAFNTNRNNIVFVAGKPFQTWQWQQDRWQRLFTEQTPPDLDWFEIHYFPPLESIILLGSEHQYDEAQLRMWRYDGLTWIPLELLTGPAPGCKGVYDPIHKRLLYTGYLISYDVWSFDGLHWTMLMKTTTSDHYHLKYALGFDVSRDRLVLAGKYHEYSNVYGWSTWEYDGQGWALVNNGKGPPGVAVYYPRTGALLMIVNLDSGHGTIVYKYNQGDWTEIDRNYSIVAGTSATVDEKKNVIYSINPPDTFSFTPEDSWQQINRQDGPQFFYRGAAGYHQKLDSVVMVTQKYEYVTTFETWLWNGSEFREIVAPFDAFYLGNDSLCYHPIRQSMFLIAKRYAYGDSNIVWEFDGYQWKSFTSIGLDSSLFYYSALVFNEINNCLTLYACDNYQSGTYQLMDDTWTLIAKNQIDPPRRGMNMVYDQHTEHIVLFGGITNSYYSQYCLNDTWEFDGTKWTQVETEIAPPFRQGGMMVYNPDIDRVVLVGGSCDNVIFNDVWEYDGSTWEQRKINDCPLTRQNAAHSYDPTRKRFVICGGNNLTEKFNSLIELEYHYN